MHLAFLFLWRVDRVYLYYYLLRLIIKYCHYTVHRCGRGIGGQVRIEPYYSLSLDLIRVPIYIFISTVDLPPNPCCAVCHYINISSYSYVYIVRLPCPVLPRLFFARCIIYIHIYTIYTLPACNVRGRGWTPTGAGGVRGSAGATKPHAQGSSPRPQVPDPSRRAPPPLFMGEGGPVGVGRSGEGSRTIL